MMNSGPFFQLPVLKTARTLLRKMTLHDAEDMFMYCADEEVSRFTTWPTHQRMADTYHFLEFVIQRYDRGEIAPWGIVDVENDRLIGTCGFVSWRPTHGRAEIGYVLSRDYWNQGYMTEVVNEVIRYGFHTMKLVRIEARCHLDNAGSAKVMEKCDMQFEGVLRKHIFNNGRYEDVKQYSIINEPLLHGM
ncbi:GNAT family N-acetyltransferase [Paenibacillus sp. OSY-SE]|uniref:GNAT family N-acetyltransferase n=1 Tax=Paenibacillus sp. OSY-SE TaxID=1196323 RepID=UPI0002F47B79|nr:GNAT family protein [Paenibacillus sp. OSY-SE]